MSTTPCHDECVYLIQLAHRLEKSMPKDGAWLESWHEKATALLASADLESLKGELELEKLSLQLRSRWLRYACHVSSRHLKSPPHFNSARLPSGRPNFTPYDRWNKPVVLEQRAASYRDTPAGWETGHIVFNSGMGAISCLFLVMPGIYEPVPDNPLQLHGVGGYFEIMDLMQFTHNELFRFRIFQDQKQFQESVARGESQLLYIEPVYTLHGLLEVFDLDGFLKAWRQRPDNIPTTIVFDTSFVANKFPMREFLERLEPRKPRAVIQIHSALKLDQEGLEFSNAGLMSVFSTIEQVTTGITRRMRKYRAHMGLGLTMEQTSALDYPGFLDFDLCERHSNSVFKNNERLARQLVTGNNMLFIAKSHPVLQEEVSEPWATAPFVNVLMQPETNEHDRDLLKYTLFKESLRRGLTFQPGSSYGFRSHRVEATIEDEPGLNTIRVAMGCREGPSLDATIDLLNEISQLGSFANLRKKYPGFVKVVRKLEESRQDAL